MSHRFREHVAILCPGNLEMRRNTTPHNDRFAQVFDAPAQQGLDVEPAVHHDRAGGSAAQRGSSRNGCLRCSDCWTSRHIACLGCGTAIFCLASGITPGTYVLCEINVSSVAPFPDCAVTHIATATAARITDVKRVAGDILKSVVPRHGCPCVLCGSGHRDLRPPSLKFRNSQP
jgi:hypothetical protein